MVARPPAELRRINPTLDLKCGLFRFRRHFQRALLHHRLRPARHHDGIPAGGQADVFTVTSVNLVVEEKVRFKPLGAQRINASDGIANFECCRRRLAGLVLHAEGDGLRRRAVEQHIDFAAKAEVLRALAGVEGNLRLALAGVPAEELDDPVLQRQSAERVAQRLLVEHREVQPQAFGVGRIIPVAVKRSGRRRVAPAVALPHRECVGADRLKRRRDPGLVVDLHEKAAPALLDQFGLRRSLLHLHARLGIDVNAEEAPRIQHRLQFRGVLLLQRCVEGFALFGAERFTDELRRLDDALDLRRERLPLDTFDLQQRSGVRRREQKQPQAARHDSKPIPSKFHNLILCWG